ncbi:hypothetical protein [Streptomyces sp. TP-A0356]|uniref:hypothetical protein n=1 Tax=Streptomyces sp. TP-A0356 TaxID=1359208 RepID=UPI0006E18277|nr:hypothetical protein [Streptomyces sp. TP-A0356]
MSESTTATTDLTSQYTAQVTSDLEQNVKEQERISAEIAALEEHLTNLQHDHTVLVNMQRALGVASAPAESTATATSAVVPAPRKKSTSEAGTSRNGSKNASKTAARSASEKTRVKRGTAAQARPTGKTLNAGKPEGNASATKTAQPTLVELVRGHLTEQSEPRSAAEIATALGQAHPERGIKATVVRTTLEGLVARNQAQRSKQGTSVFYTAAETSEPTAAREAEARTDQAG